MDKHLPEVAAFGVEELVDGQVQVDTELESVVHDEGGGHGLQGVGVPGRKRGRERGREAEREETVSASEEVS